MRCRVLTRRVTKKWTMTSESTLPKASQNKHAALSLPPPLLPPLKHSGPPLCNFYVHNAAIQAATRWRRRRKFESQYTKRRSGKRKESLLATQQSQQTFQKKSWEEKVATCVMTSFVYTTAASTITANLDVSYSFELPRSASSWKIKMTSLYFSVREIKANKRMEGKVLPTISPTS